MDAIYCYILFHAVIEQISDVKFLKKSHSNWFIEWNFTKIQLEQRITWTMLIQLLQWSMHQRIAIDLNGLGIAKNKTTYPFPSFRYIVCFVVNFFHSQRNSIELKYCEIFI